MAGMYNSSRDLSRDARFRITERTNTGYNRVTEGVVSLPGRQVTRSYRTRGPEADFEGPGEPRFLNFATGDTGHPFDTLKEEVKCPVRRIASGEAMIPGQARGSVFGGYGPIMLEWDTNPNPGKRPYRNFATPSSLTETESNMLGSRYILATTPTAPQANLLLTLAELAREGLPAIPGVTTLRDRVSPKNLGGESLNYQFGIAPLVSDLQAIAEAVVAAPKILEQFRRDSGKVITRKRQTVYDPSTTITTKHLGSRLPVVADPQGSGSGALNGAFADLWRMQAMECLDRVNVTTRFSGAYQYELDVGDDAISKLKSFEAQANYLLGTRLTPELLWNLAPWSWLTDWFANIGDILGNASRFMSDGLVLKYGYLMRHTVSTRYLTYTPSSLSAAKGMTWVTRYRSERKERVPATPFGFGVAASGLSSYQTGIVASLASANVPDRSPRSPRR